MASARGEKKALLFEKRSKNFCSCGELDDIFPVPAPTPLAQGAKVFWFFFSKKNRFLT
jgi:hypothetical protein